MTIVNDPGDHRLNWLPPEKIEYNLRVYERVAFEDDVSILVLRRSARYLARLITSEMARWARQGVRPSLEWGLEYDEENELRVDIPWVRGIAADLRDAESRTDLVLALDAFWHDYHESFLGAEERHTSLEAKRIFRRLSELAGEEV